MPDQVRNRRETDRNGRARRRNRAGMIIRGVLPLAVAIAAAVAVVLGASFLYTGITLRAPRGQSRSGSRYLASGDYEQAIESYREVLADDPDNEEARTNLENAYIEYAESYAGTGDYSNAVIILRQAGTVLSGAENIESALATIYQAWGASLVETGDYDTALSVLSAGSSYGDMTSGIRNVYLTWAGNAELAGNFDTAFSIISRGMDAAGGDDSLEQKSLEIQALQKLYAFTLQTAKVPRVGENEYQALRSFVSDQGGSVAFADEQMGLYNTDEHIMMYVGTYTDGERSGAGRWESVNTGNTSLTYVCTWENDVPQGQFSFEQVNEDGTTEAVTGNAADGLFSGTCLVTDRNGVIWDITYQNGIPQEASETGSAAAATADADTADAADDTGTADIGTDGTAASDETGTGDTASGTDAADGTDTAGTADTAAGTGTEVSGESDTTDEIVIADSAINSTSSGVLTIARSRLSQTDGIEGYADNLVY